MYYLIVFAVMPLISPMMFLSITIPAHMSKSTPTLYVSCLYISFGEIKIHVVTGLVVTRVNYFVLHSPRSWTIALLTPFLVNIYVNIK